jgi:thiol-disulfide isomerase/thioredoxin
MKEKLKYYIKEILIFTVAMIIITNLISIYKSQELSTAPLTIHSLKLIDNQTYNFATDKPLLIHFWATWCPVCKIEAPNIEFIKEHFNVITIAVDSGSNLEIKKYLQEKGYNFLVVNDKSRALSKEFNVVGYPTTFIYNKDKKLIFSEVGYTSSIGLYLRMWWASFRD